MAKAAKYGVGEQSFRVLREGGFLYIDKTQYIEKIINESQYYFLGRPRRFGKSLFLSTLKFFFEGRRDLFKGLHADTIDWDWAPHPVLHISLNMWDYSKPGVLDVALNAHLVKWEQEYKPSYIASDVSSRFSNIIEQAYKQTGKGVVILVDEYDNPLVDNLNNPQLFEYYRRQLSAIYSNFKSSADYIRLVFLTGVSRFGKISVFSGLNNIKDISFRNDYAAICGITQQELVDNFQYGIRQYAESEQISEEEVLYDLKRWYDGYHFSPNCPDIYNPFSLLNSMDEKRLSSYWMTSGGVPTILWEGMKKGNCYNLEALLSSQVNETQLLGIDMDSDDPLPLLYQTGYLTIKDYDKSSMLYTLGLPNSEVKKGFLEYLLPKFSSINKNRVPFEISLFVKDVNSGNAEGFMQRLQTLFAGYSYEMRLENENNLHNVIFMLMLLMGINVQTEYKTSDGRIDLLITTDKYRYIIELKIDSTPEEALRQINDKQYALSFDVGHKTVIKIGANFSNAERRFSGWIISM